MRVEDRTAVLVLGGTINSTPFRSRNLSVRKLRHVEELDDAEVRGLILIVRDLVADAERQRLVKNLRRYAQRAAQSGVLVVIACAPGSEGGAQIAARSGAAVLAQMQANTGLPFVQVAALPLNDLARMAETIARHDCGPSQNTELKIVDKDGTPFPLEAEVACLIRRAFWEFEAVELDDELGGRSSSDGVWRVNPRSPDRALRSPFVVKCGPIAAIDEHINTFRDVVEDRVPYRGCAPVCFARSPRGATKRLIVSRFVENAQRLDRAVLERDVTSLVTSIYTSVLERWRSESEWNTSSPFDEFLPRGVWRTKYQARLETTERSLSEAGVPVATAATLRDRLYAVGAQSRPYVRAHNDLNITNVFACEGTSDPVLIDFTRAKKRPLSYDCARLDVGLAFDVESPAEQQMPEEVILALYQGDLFAMPLDHKRRGAVAKHRINAIEAVRIQVLDDAERLHFDVRQEYAVAICAGLLYYARNDNVIGRLAYRCAAQLAMQV